MANPLVGILRIGKILNMPSFTNLSIKPERDKRRKEGEEIVYCSI